MSNSRKASSVDWFYQQIRDHGAGFTAEELLEWHRQAQAMHREEHLETWVESAVQHRKENHYTKKILFFEEYYNETFGNGKETK